jgi:hypothetical protein
MEAHFIMHKHFRLDHTGGSNLYNYLISYQCLKKLIVSGLIKYFLD